jgi:secondary thiamine-phosphate synthase enzyme
LIWSQHEITLRPRERGFHLVTDEILRQVPEVRGVRRGMFFVFIRHTSASITINENADASVRGDLERHLNILAPESAAHYQHDTEGPDDMPAHIKASLLGSSLSVPITDGRLNLGTWQGIYLCEHRNHGGPRQIVVTVLGEAG